MASPDHNERDKQGMENKMKTLVFLDFEATGLLGPAQRPRITELCLLAVHRDDLSAGIGFPRVLNKLTLCLNPKKSIQMGSSQITGLYNDTLERQKDFSPTTVTMINGFLSHLAEPVCLIAHYGNGYDFPLLKAELNRINQSLGDGIYCADSLELFRSLDGLEMVKNCIPPPPFTPANVPVQFISDYRTPQKSKPEGSPGVKRKSPEPEPSTTNDVSTKKEKSGTETGVAVRRVLMYGDPQGSKTLKANGPVGKPEADLNSKQTAGDAFTNELLDEFGFSDIDDEELVAAADMAEKQLQKASESNSVKSKSVRMHSAANGQEFSFQTRNTTNGNYVMAGSGYSLFNKVENKSCSSVRTVGANNGTNNGKHQTFKQMSSTDNSSNASSSNRNTTSHKIYSPSNSSPVTVTTSAICVSSSKTLNTSVITSRNVPPVTSTTSVTINVGTYKGLTSPVLPGRSVSPSNGNGGKTISSPPKKSFKLVEIYRRIFGQPPPESHRAEDDCVTLLKCAQRTDDFLAMVDKHADLFSAIKPGY